ncbi:MAG: glycosyltransferase 87 family protein [Microbacterium sp.]|uniref:glycosyltransferase 87 family protein n=1 Tax=Microbacterium sp. TaxID=51671 RepID=UPI0039E44607
MSKRVVLWAGFAAVHVCVAYLGLVLPNWPAGDVVNVYDPWSSWALEGISAGADTPWIVGIDQQWVYPQLALVPMVLAQLVSWIAGYQAAWVLVATAANAAGFAVLVGRGRSAGRRLAAWWWLAGILLLGPVAIYRVDSITVPLAVAGGLWLAGRPWLGGTLLAVATWIKVWPAALIAAAVVSVRRRAAVVIAAVAVSALVVIAVSSGGGAAHVFGFIEEQTGRALQLEAPVSSVHVWLAALGADGARVFYDANIITFEVDGPGADAVAAAMTPVLLLALVAIGAIGAVKARRGASFVLLFPALSLALVLAFIVLNKVGSPQYYVWIIAPIALALALDRRRWWRIALLGLAVCCLTQIVYPLVYAGLTALPRPAIDSVLVLVLRNLCAVALFAWSLVKLVRVRTRPVRVREGKELPC